MWWYSSKHSAERKHSAELQMQHPFLQYKERSYDWTISTTFLTLRSNQFLGHDGWFRGRVTWNAGMQARTGNRVLPDLAFERHNNSNLGLHDLKDHITDIQMHSSITRESTLTFEEFLIIPRNYFCLQHHLPAKSDVFRACSRRPKDYLFWPVCSMVLGAAGKWT